MNASITLPHALRRRHVPARFSWLDHRLWHDDHLAGCASTDALALYLALSVVADARGVSFYSDRRLATALGYHACEKGRKVRFINTMEMINQLEASSQRARLAATLKTYLSPDLLILDELGYLPIDQRGADLLFQVISGRYEQGSTIITTNKAYQDWVKIFRKDGALTSAVLDRLLHRSQTVTIEGKSYRMKDRID